MTKKPRLDIWMWTWVVLCMAGRLFGSQTNFVGADAGDYVITSWHIRDGLPSDRIRAVLQTRDGYIVKQKAPVQPCGRTEANWGLGVRHSLFPVLTLGAPLRGCQLPDAILHGKRSFRPHSRAVQRLAVTELSSEASWLAWAGVCSAGLRTRSRHVCDSDSAS